MTPRVTIVTTVYDRIECLRRCLRSVQHLHFKDFEQLVVSDCPGADIEAQIDHVVAETGDPRIRHIRRETRANDWGMTTAFTGRQAAAGEFVCFLSDDNAYLQDHFGPLIAAFDRDPGLGFVYSSCLYGGRHVLATAPPAGARIDLGQPLFRTSVLPPTLPFHEFAWDWCLIHMLMEQGVRWHHHNLPSFVFRLDSYPSIREMLA